MSNTLETIFGLRHEQVVFCQEPAAGYSAIIAIHNTTLGPAVGGTRETLLEVYALAAQQKITSAKAAGRFAEQRLQVVAQ